MQLGPRRKCLDDPFESDFFLRTVGEKLGRQRRRRCLKKQNGFGSLFETISFPQRRNCIICLLGCSFFITRTRESSFFTNFSSDNFLTWINDNNFQWNDSGASAGVQCRSRITNKSLRFTNSQLSDVFSLHLAGTSLRPCQKKSFLPLKAISSLSQFIFLLSTRNCYYFAIKSSSLIDLLAVNGSARSRSQGVPAFVIGSYFCLLLSFFLLHSKLVLALATK